MLNIFESWAKDPMSFRTISQLEAEYQAFKDLIQPVLVPHPGRSAGTHSQAGSTNPSQLGRSAGTLSQVGNIVGDSTC